MRARPFGLTILLALAAPASWAQAPAPTVVLTEPTRPLGGTVSVTLQAADAATISRSMGDALGGAVRIEGTTAAPVTLDLQGATAQGALDAVARALHGKWKPVYSIVPGGTAGGQRPVALGRTVTANLTGVSARTALSLVARAAGGSVEMVADLPQKVSLNAQEMPVEQALDEIARQVGGSWSVGYVIKVGVAPPPPTSQPSPNSGVRSPAGQPGSSGSRSPDRDPGAANSRTVPPGFAPPGVPQDVLNDQRFFPKPFEPRTPAPDANAAKMLTEGLIRVMQMPPPHRQMAVKDFAAQIDQQFRQLQTLPATRRNEQMAAMRPLYQAATRTFNGLAPAQRREFQPILDVFSRWMR